MRTLPLLLALFLAAPAGLGAKPAAKDAKAAPAPCWAK